MQKRHVLKILCKKIEKTIDFFKDERIIFYIESTHGAETITKELKMKEFKKNIKRFTALNEKLAAFGAEFCNGKILLKNAKPYDFSFVCLFDIKVIPHDVDLNIGDYLPNLSNQIDALKEKNFINRA